MSNFAYSAIFFIVGLGLLIAIHEFGHYWVARKCGVKVLKFSIGFGRPLWSTKRGQDNTEYVLAMIPLGGYVKMLDEREGEVAPQEQHRAFNRQTLGKRFAIVAAGPVFNFVFAIFAYWAIFVAGVPGLKPVVGEIGANSVLAKAGLRVDDEIISVSGHVTPTLEAMRMAMVQHVVENSVVDIVVSNAQHEERTLSVDFSAVPVSSIEENFLQFIGYTPKRPHLPALLGELQADGAAQKAGFRVGDLVTEVDGTPVSDWFGWANYVRERPGKSVQVTFVRDGQSQTLVVVPATLQAEGKSIGRVGASPKTPDKIDDSMMGVHRFDVFEAFPAALRKTWDMSILTLRMFGKMIVGEASLENISGPITIAQYAGQTAQIGTLAFISFLAIVSVSLGVLNLLPVPVLDGGHLMFYIIEFIKRSPVSDYAQEMGQRVGVGLLASLMFLALFNDVNRLLG